MKGWRATATALLVALGAATAAIADDGARHGLSLFGDVKYPSDFAHFDYVNPDAPTGGLVRYAAIGGFDSFNPFIIKGRAASGITLIYDTLLTSSFDEPGSEYGLVAQSVSYPADFSSVTFKLRPEARWHDGQPITPEDVIWTLDALKANSPFYNAYYANVLTGTKIDAHTVRFEFTQKGNRELPLIMGQLPVLPKHFWEGADASGAARDFSETSLEPPLGSGPYRVGEVKPGQSVTYERVADYWGADLPVNRGAHNFSQIRFEYFGDTTVALEAFKAHRVDVRIENSAKNWATAYDIPAVRDGRIVLEKLPDQNPSGMQAFAFNIRRDKFADPRVRLAFNYAFDFEWQNKTLFYGQYQRTNSYFANSELAAQGLPSEAELALLEPFRDQLPEEIFEKPFASPATDGSGNNRANLKRAGDLLAEAGWVLKDGKLQSAKTGEPFAVEFLLVDPAFERVVAPFVQSLKRLGITSSIRSVDTSQYQNRIDSFDFDIIVHTFPQSLSPGNEQRDFWSCASAEQKGGRNVIGICDPVVEALIDKIIFATSRDELVTATRALDRVLLWHHYVVPQWHIPYTRLARWTTVRHPDPVPAYSIGFPTIWWHEGDAPQN